MKTEHIPLADYQVTEQIQEMSETLVYRGVKENDQTPVLIKLYKSEHPTSQELAKLEHEFEITKTLEIDGVPRPYGLEKYNQGLALILEDIGGRPLKQQIPPTGMPVMDFLKNASLLANVLSEIHNHHIIHMKIRPSSTFFNPENDRLQISEFSRASLLSTERWQINHPELLGETLAYMSPEQTGRMNRAIDQRTDLYSLGVTFYEMLTGKLPFVVNDPMEWVHAHIAKTPIPLYQQNPVVPAALSAIIMKLLSKTAEDRYQSSYGLKLDLERCLDAFQHTGTIENFTLGQQDISDQFKIPDKLYGRESEVSELMQAFDRVVESGQSEMVLVSGYSGIGKSSVIHEIHIPIVRQRGHFIRGKFDQYHRNLPYASMIQAFRDLIQQLLIKNETEIAFWKKKLEHAFGPNGQVIIDVIPEVELIVGKQPAIQKLTPAETQNRFNAVFIDFVYVFATAEYPLVLFLDDLQWADVASLNLIELLLTDPDNKFLLFLGTFRDNEVEASHPLTLTLSKIRKAQIGLTEIHLKPLSLEHVNELIADTLNCSQEHAKSLGDLVFSKTHGNPFFLYQFLKSLHQEGLLRFDMNQRKWQWHPETIQAKELTDNVVEFMSKKILQLPTKIRQVLILASCIGNRFDLQTLFLLNKESDPSYGVWQALEEGLIVPDGEQSHERLQIDTLQLDAVRRQNHPLPVGLNICKFSHDRVQQAAYSLIPREEQERLHLQIGRLLLKSTKPEELEENIFSISAQLNMGHAFITAPNERLELAKLNLQAGKRAKDSIAYSLSLTNLTLGIKLLPKECWQKKYALTFDLYKECAECEYLNGNFENAEQLFDILLREAATSREKAEVYSTKMVLYTNMGKNHEAVALGQAGLRLLGIHLPADPSKFPILIDLLKVNWQLYSKHIENLADLPVMDHADRKLSMDLLMNLLPPAYFTSQDLFALIILKIMHLTLVHGNAKQVSPYAYSTYGMLIGSGFGRYKAGYKFGELGIQLGERFHDIRLMGLCNFFFGCFINNWINPARTNNEYLLKSYTLLLDSGTLFYAGYAVSALIFNRSVTGETLDTIYEEAQKYLDFANKIKDTDSVMFFIIIQQSILNLKGKTKTPFGFDTDQFDEENQVAAMQSKSEQIPLHWYFLKKAQALYLLNNYPEAHQMILQSETMLEGSLGQIFVPEHYLYSSLILAAFYPEVSSNQKKKFRKLLKRNRNHMNRWQKLCPENFAHQYFLIQAEMMRITGKQKEAIEFYNQAILSARANGYLQNEAIANELAAKFYLELGQQAAAQPHLAFAHYGYQRWGAVAKVKQLEEQYSPLLSSMPFKLIAPQDEVITASEQIISENKAGALDLVAIIKASQALSGEILLDKLLTTLAKIVIENAGAQRGVLLLESNGQLFIEAEGTAEQEEVIVLKSTPIDARKDLPIAVINYVARTREIVVLNDAQKDETFVNDSYIQNSKSHSILCLPITHQRNFTGILYLENNLSTNVFVSDRLEVLNLLSSQIAISIENARLYQSLQKLLEEVSQANKELKTTQAQLIQSAKLAAIGELAAGIAHELNTPLHAINMCVANLQDIKNQPGIDNQRLSAEIQDIRQMVKRCSVIINQLKVYSRRDEFDHREKTDLNQVIQNAFILIGEQFRKMDIKVIQNLSEKLPPVSSNPMQIEQVLTNLFNNAKDAMQTCPMKELRVRSFAENGCAVITVEDTGTGIPEKLVDKIFEPFFTTKPVGEGTGLGMPISYEIIRNHQGQIQVTTQEGKGTSFRIEIPVLDEKITSESLLIK